MRPWNYLTATGVWLLLALCSVVLLSAPSFAAKNSSFSISLGFDFASGDYGTAQTTDSYSIPLTIGYYPSARLDFSLEIPYLYQSDSSTVLLGGTRFPMQGTGGGPGSSMGGMGGSTTSVTSSQSGIGDINLTAGFQVVAETPTSPMLRPLVYLKAPTADKEKGLGTGAFDFGGGLSAGKIIGNWSIYGEALYIIPGSTSAYKPDNYLTYQGSLRYQLSQNLNIGSAISGGTPAFTEASDTLEIQLTSRYRVSENGSIGIYLGKGLTDSSPDYTTGFYGSISF